MGFDMKRYSWLILYCFALWFFLPIACQPAPEPTPQPTVALPTDIPVDIFTPVFVPATLTPVTTGVPTRTPQPAYPGPAVAPEPFAPAGEAAPRLGVAAAALSARWCDGREWVWWWSTTYPKQAVGCEGQAPPPHVPMIAWGPETYNLTAAENAAKQMTPDTWLVFNECENNWQCNTSPETAARFYHDTIVPFAYGLDPGARLIVGGSNAGRCGMEWLERFVEYYRAEYHEDVPRAGFHFHIYPETWSGPACDAPWGWSTHIYYSLDLVWAEWVTQAENIRRFLVAYGRTGDEAWITEMGCLSPAPSICPEQSYVIAERSLRYFDEDGRFITRYSWFADGGTVNGIWDWTNLYWIGADATLTRRPIGDLWLNHEPLPAVPMTVYKRWFPIVGYASDVVPAAPVVPAVMPNPYPAPEGLHP